MKTKSSVKATAIVAAVALAAAIVPGAAFAGTYGQADVHDDGNTPDTTANDNTYTGSATMGVWVDADSDGNGAPDTKGGVSTDADDVISGTWSVTIPDQLALTPTDASNAGKPGTYSGTATITYKGMIGTSQKLTIASSAVTMKDANKWSKDVTATVADNGLSNLDYATVYNEGNGGSGTTAITATLGAGSWSGIDTYTISLSQ